MVAAMRRMLEPVFRETRIDDKRHAFDVAMAGLQNIQQIAVLFPDLSERQQQTITREQQVWQQIISRAVERREVQPDIDTDLMAQTFIALFYGRAYRDSLTNGLDADLLKRQMLQLYEAIALK